MMYAEPRKAAKCLFTTKFIPLVKKKTTCTLSAYHLHTAVSTDSPGRKPDGSQTTFSWKPLLEHQVRVICDSLGRNISIFPL